MAGISTTPDDAPIASAGARASLALRSGLRALRASLNIGLLVAVLIAAPASSGCKSVCQKFADHLEECRLTYCESRADHPICGERYAERNNSVEDCPDVLRPIVEEQLEEDCETLAREHGWEALGNLP